MLVQCKHKDWAYVDRISDLPDSILTHILSLLPTKLAASTCVLSKRWQFVWVMVHNVDLVCNTAEGYSHLKFDRFASTIRKFANLLNRFFTLRDENKYMKTFRLQFLSVIDSVYIDIDSWVLAAMSSAIEELDIHLQLHFPFMFSCSIFTCKTLELLKLHGNIVINPPPSSVHFPRLKVLHLYDVVIDAPSSSVHFPSLKVLHLYDVAAENPDSYGNLFSGCPVLEKLVLNYARQFKEFGPFVITSPTLRCLTMDFSCRGFIRLCLDAPSLEYLKLKLVAHIDIHLKNLDNLVHADVDLLPLRLYSDDNVRILHVVNDVMKPLCNVQVLKLKQQTMEAFRDVSFEDFPVFHNLVQLELYGFCGMRRNLLPLFQKLPYLQHLTVHHNSCYFLFGDILGSKAWADLEFSHLTTLCFNNSSGNGLSCGDMEFLTYVLKNSKGLENMTITACGGHFRLDEKHAFWKKLASLERASKECQLKFEREVL